MDNEAIGGHGQKQTSNNTRTTTAKARPRSFVRFLFLFLFILSFFVQRVLLELCSFLFLRRSVANALVPNASIFSHLDFLSHQSIPFYSLSSLPSYVCLTSFVFPVAGLVPGSRFLGMGLAGLNWVELALREKFRLTCSLQVVLYLSQLLILTSSSSPVPRITLHTYSALLLVLRNSVRKFLSAGSCYLFCLRVVRSYQSSTNAINGLAVDKVGREPAITRTARLSAICKLLKRLLHCNRNPQPATRNPQCLVNSGRLRHLPKACFSFLPAILLWPFSLAL